MEQGGKCEDATSCANDECVQMIVIPRSRVRLPRISRPRRWRVRILDRIPSFRISILFVMRKVQLERYWRKWERFNVESVGWNGGLESCGVLCFEGVFAVQTCNQQCY